MPGINGRDPAVDEDTQPFVTPDKQHMYWTSVRVDRYAIMTADWVGDTYANARAVVRSNVFQRPLTGKLIAIGEANLADTPQGSLLFMICGVATRETGPMLGAKLRLCRAKKDRASPRDGGS